jgi:hypothetical protein
MLGFRYKLSAIKAHVLETWLPAGGAIWGGPETLGGKT